MHNQPFHRFAVVLLTMLLLAGSAQAQATESQTINAGWLLEAARSTILTSSPWINTECVVDITGTPNDIVVYQGGRIVVDAVLERVPNSLRDIGAVSVEVYVGGELYMRFDPTPYLTVSVPVFRAANGIDRDQVLSEDDIEEALVDVRTLPTDDMFESHDDIIGLAARMNIQVGRIFTVGLLELPTLVHRGDDVLVNIPLGTAYLTLLGSALDSGAMGEEIRVRNPDSNTIITAIVTGQSRATINLLY